MKDAPDSATPGRKFEDDSPAKRDYHPPELTILPLRATMSGPSLLQFFDGADSYS